MAAYVAYTPTTVIGSAMFNFDAFGLTNFNLNGTVRVSVSDGFSLSDLLSPAYSNFYSQLFTSGSEEWVWTAQMTASVQDILGIFSHFANIAFQWQGDYDAFTGGSDLTPNPEDVGRNNLSDINIAWVNRSDGTFAGISGINTDSLLGYTGAAGDIFLNAYAPKFSGDFTLDLNTRARQTLMHELGHSLGLSHPHSAYSNGVPTITADYAATRDLGFGQLGFHIDSAADMYKEYFTIMSYDDQQSLLPGSTVLFHAHTPMILDVIALQQAYGEGAGTTGPGNDTIAAGTAGYRTYFDTGGTDTIDVSIYTDGAYLEMGVSIAGADHMVGVAMSLHDARITIVEGGDPANLRWFYGEYENAVGASSDDVLVGNPLDNVIDGRGGNDYIDGRSGVDSAVYAGVYRSYALTGNPVITASLGGPEGMDSLAAIEKLVFLDGSLYFNADAHIAQVERLYLATLDRLADPMGLNNWVGNLDAGGGLNSMAGSFVASAEFQAHYGALNNVQFVNQLYLNVLDRTADPGGLVFWSGQLDAGTARGQVVTGFSESAEFIQNNAALVNAGLWDIDETAASVARLYFGALGRAPEVGGLTFHVSGIKTGQFTLSQDAEIFVSSAEFQAIYGAPDEPAFVNQLYQNVLHRTADAGGFAYWTGQLQSQAMTHGAVTLEFTESQEYQLQTLGQIDHGIAALDAHFP